MVVSKDRTLQQEGGPALQNEFCGKLFQLRGIKIDSGARLSKTADSKALNTYVC